LSHVETDGPHRLRVHLKEPFSPWIKFLTKHMGVGPTGSREKPGNDYFRLTPKNQRLALNRDAAEIRR
jgi:hypothetical protein